MSFKGKTLKLVGYSHMGTTNFRMDRDDQVYRLTFKLRNLVLYIADDFTHYFYKPKELQHPFGFHCPLFELLSLYASRHLSFSVLYHC